MDLELEGIVIRSNPYKEKDQMIMILTENGVKSFLARGISAINAKNASICNLFSLSKFSIIEKNNHFTLKNGQLISSFYHLYESIEVMVGLGLMSDLIQKFLDKDDGRIYPFFKAILNGSKDSKKMLTFIAIFFAKIITFSGYGLNYEHCAVCDNQKSIVGISYLKGGFLCKKHLEYPEEKRSLSYLKSFRMIFKIESIDIPRLELKDSIALELIKDLSDYLLDAFGFKELSSLKLFLSLYKDK